MYGSAVILYPLIIVLLSHRILGQECLKPQTIDITSETLICSQPYFVSFLPKNENNILLDNVCLTFFPLPEDPNTFLEFNSFVYCDGSNYVESYIVTSVSKGTFKNANPMVTFTDSVVGYAGCDIYVVYRCYEFGDVLPPYTSGFSTKSSPAGLSCLRKVEEVISNAGLPNEDFYILPNKLPNRCVTKAACTIPPNPFYNKLGPSVGLVY